MLYVFDLNEMLARFAKEGRHFYELPETMRRQLIMADGRVGAYERRNRRDVVRIDVKTPSYSPLYDFTIYVALDDCRPDFGAIWTEDHYEKVYAH